MSSSRCAKFVLIGVVCWLTQFAGASLHAEEAAKETYGEALSKRLGVRAVNLDVDGHPAFMLLPEEKKQSTPQPWIMYAPALPAYPDAGEAWMHRQFLDAGIAVVGIDVGEAYGSPAARKAMSALYGQLVDRRDFARKLCLLGRSRGGLWVTNWAVDNPEKVAGIAGIYPVFDLRVYPAIAKAAPAYGLTEAELLQQLDQHNPVARLQPLIDARTPMFMVHGDVDEVVPLESNSAAVAEKFKAAGAGDSVTVKVIKGQGHNFHEAFFKCQELVDFAIKQARAGAQPDDGPKRFPVSGTVTIDGVPLKAGMVTIASEGKRPAMGPIDDAGRFTMSTFETGDGVVPGTHRISVTAREPIDAGSHRWNAPKKYAMLETSGLKATIEGPQENLEIKLTWDGGKPFVEKN